VAADLSAWLPTGLAGGVGMIRNWTFTLFYCMSELWGDVVLSLLFWGLANETTALKDASLLYPLFGIGANVGQVRSCIGRVLVAQGIERRLSVPPVTHRFCCESACVSTEAAAVILALTQLQVGAAVGCRPFAHVYPHQNSRLSVRRI